MGRLSCGMIFLWDDFLWGDGLRIIAFVDVFVSADVSVSACLFVADDVFLRMIVYADDSFCS